MKQTWKAIFQRTPAPTVPPKSIVWFVLCCYTPQVPPAREPREFELLLLVRLWKPAMKRKRNILSGPQTCFQRPREGCGLIEMELPHQEMGYLLHLPRFSDGEDTTGMVYWISYKTVTLLPFEWGTYVNRTVRWVIWRNGWWVEGLRLPGQSVVNFSWTSQGHLVIGCIDLSSVWYTMNRKNYKCFITCC